MGKKKPFINKKNASTYHLLHRSQRDVAGDILHANDNHKNNEDDDDKGASSVLQHGMVLWPSPDNKRETDQAVLLGTTQEEDVTSTTVSSHQNQQQQQQQQPVSMSTWRQRLADAGLLDEGPEKYMKPISGTGLFLDAPTEEAAAQRYMELNDDGRFAGLEEQAILEVQRQFDSIPLTADCMDEEIAQALFGELDEGDFEELNDDFVLQAAQEPEVLVAADSDADAEADTFDFDAHIQKLMEKARLERTGGAGGPNVPVNHVWAQQDQVYFEGLRPVHEQDDDDDDDDEEVAAGMMMMGDHWTVSTELTPGVVPKLNPDEERALCQKFEETLAEYDSDEVGDCPEEDVGGTKPLEGDAVIEEALQDFLQERDDQVFIHGSTARKNRRQGQDSNENSRGGGGSGYSALVGKQMVPAKQLALLQTSGDDDKPVPVNLVLAQAKQRLAEPIQGPPPEEVLIDGKSYFSEKERNPWDCESILSTYSNLSNNPMTIQGGGRRSLRRKQKQQQQSRNNTPVDNDGDDDNESEAPSLLPQIQLSAKTGLPLGVLPSRHSHNNNNNDPIDESHATDTYMSVNRGEARNKHETAEEKKARKALIKRQRQWSRIQKKVSKEVYREEFQRHAMEVGVDDVAGKTVFRYS